MLSPYAVFMCTGVYHGTSTQGTRGRNVEGQRHVAAARRAAILIALSGPYRVYDWDWWDVC
jgi:hypothetical protein